MEFREKRLITLADVGRTVASGGDYTAAMKEFIDSMACGLRDRGARAGIPLPLNPQMYETEPTDPGDPLLRAHLGAMAEHLAGLALLPPPGWSGKPEYFLRIPVFFGGRHSKEDMLAETPSAFRRRLLFCGPVLSRIEKLLSD
jgi:hypothetical protein